MISKKIIHVIVSVILMFSVAVGGLFLFQEGNMPVTVQAHTTEAIICASYDIQEIPLINEDFAFEIPHIESGEVVLIGRVVICPDNPFTLIVSADEDNSDYGFFLALNDSPSIQTVINTTWYSLRGNEKMIDSHFNFTSDSERTAYLYISGGLGSLTGNTITIGKGSIIGSGILTNVTGRILVASE
jgi:uncharacterized protein YxeA